MSLVTVSDGVATYSCEKGYVVRGERTRECRGGAWRRKEPSCEGNERILSILFIYIPISQLLNALTQNPRQMVL
jgi:hypothetical protein